MNASSWPGFRPTEPQSQEVESRSEVRPLQCPPMSDEELKILLLLTEGILHKIKIFSKWHLFTNLQRTSGNKILWSLNDLLSKIRIFLFPWGLKYSERG